MFYTDKKNQVLSLDICFKAVMCHIHWNCCTDCGRCMNSVQWNPTLQTPLHCGHLDNADTFKCPDNLANSTNIKLPLKCGHSSNLHCAYNTKQNSPDKPDASCCKLKKWPIILYCKLWQCQVRMIVPYPGQLMIKQQQMGKVVIQQKNAEHSEKNIWSSRGNNKRVNLSTSSSNTVLGGNRHFSYSYFQWQEDHGTSSRQEEGHSGNGQSRRWW